MNKTHSPKVSIVLPSLNVGAYIRECLESVCGQTLADIEILCVDAGSTDGTLETIQSFAERDVRIRMLHAPERSYGAQVNLGIEAATGKYLGIVETDDLIAPNMYERLYEEAETHQCDMVKADFYHFNGDWATNAQKSYMHACNDRAHYGVVLDARKDRAALQFSPIVSGIYRRDFLLSNGIRLHPSPGASYQDVGFYLQTHFCVRRLLFVPEAFYRYRRDRPESSINSKEKVFVICDELAFARKMLERELKGAFKHFFALYARDLFYAYWSAYHRIGMQHKLAFLERFAKDLRALLSEDNRFLEELSPSNRTRVHAIALSPRTFLETTNAEWRMWRNELSSSTPQPPVIVSLTSYAKRISTVHHVIQQMLNQTLLPDKILLYLAKEERSTLPTQLTRLVSPRFEIRFVDDLKSHKKYFYAFRDFPEAIIITVDDDVDYPRNLVERLLASYHRFPYAASGARSHTICMTLDKTYATYADWMRTPKIVNRSSPLVLLTGAGGILYPPHCFTSNLLDEATIRATCLTADDLWLKWNLLESGVPCVYVPNLWTGKSIMGSQEESLYQKNVSSNGRQSLNDIAWRKILKARRPQSDVLTQLLCVEYTKIATLPRIRTGLWIFRKLRGLRDCLKENGVHYTIRHAKEKLLRKRSHR